MGRQSGHDYRADLVTLVSALWGETPGVFVWEDTLRLARRASVELAGKVADEIRRERKPVRSADSTGR